MTELVFREATATKLVPGEHIESPFEGSSTERDRILQLGYDEVVSRLNRLTTPRLFAPAQNLSMNLPAAPLRAPIAEGIVGTKGGRTIRITATLVHDVRDLLDSIRADRHLDEPERLASRLEDLTGALEEEPDAEPISPESVLHLLDALRRYRWRRPNLVVTPAGNIGAVWKRPDRRYIFVESFQDGRLMYIMRIPDANAPNGLRREAEITDPEGLAHALRANNFEEVVGRDVHGGEAATADRPG